MSITCNCFFNCLFSWCESNICPTCASDVSHPNVSGSPDYTATPLVPAIQIVAMHHIHSTEGSANPTLTGRVSLTLSLKTPPHNRGPLSGHFDFSTSTNSPETAFQRTSLLTMGSPYLNSLPPTAMNTPLQLGLQGDLTDLPNENEIDVKELAPSPCRSLKAEEDRAPHNYSATTILDCFKS
jgi:hypothetical protein